MNGGYIELVFMGFFSTNVHIQLGRHHLAPIIQKYGYPFEHPTSRMTQNKNGATFTLVIAPVRLQTWFSSPVFLLVILK